VSSTTERVPVRDDLTAVMPYGAPQLDVAVRLNTNETPQPPPPTFLAEVAGRIQGLPLHRYPDRPHRELRAALAARHERHPAQVWAANGSNEVLLQLLQAYGGPGRRALIVRPGYSMYPELARTTLTPTVEADLDASFRLSASAAAAAVGEHDPALVLVASPNNPAGTLVGHDSIQALHDGSRALVVVDEAYVEFAPPGSSAVALLDALPRLVVVRTFSKAFGLAGLRLGYLLAAEWVVADVEKVRLPYHLDVIKQVAGVVALEHEEAFLAHRHDIVRERDRVAAALRGHPDVEVVDSAANFLLVRTPLRDLFDQLLVRGVLVRDFSTRPRLAGCVRVTIGTPADNDAFLAAMADVVGVPPPTRPEQPRKDAA
jgi:histidinol-phosphate aminotransferase